MQFTWPQKTATQKRAENNTKQSFSALAKKIATELEHGWHGNHVNPWGNMLFRTLGLNTSTHDSGKGRAILPCYSSLCGGKEHFNLVAVNWKNSKKRTIQMAI